jgi:hypothetical protein
MARLFALGTSVTLIVVGGFSSVLLMVQLLIFRISRKDKAMNEQETFRNHIRNREWYEAALILRRYYNSREDCQDWLSGGDTTHILNRTLDELATEFDEYTNE